MANKYLDDFTRNLENHPNILEPNFCRGADSPLNKGEKMFKEAINYLKNTNPMNNLILNEDISIELPTEKEFNNNFNYLRIK